MESRIVTIRRLFIMLSIVGSAIAVSMTIFTLASSNHAIVSLFSNQEVDPTDVPRKSRGLIVDTPACRIPDVDPYDISVAKLIKPRRKILCSGKPSITYEDGNMLRINWAAVNTTYKGNFSSCKYQSILRWKISDFLYTLGPLKEIKGDAEIHDRFIKVHCINKTNSTFYTNFHSFVFPNNATENRCDEKYKQHLSKNKLKEVLNVVLLGIDSVSRLNFIRQMPMTRNYLLKDLGAIEMFGYTKVADNTFVNIVPLLSGKFVHELPWGKDTKQTFDKYNFIWKNFSNSGYRTFYGEDAPSISTFTYLKHGFRNPPTDHYNRVMSIAMDRNTHSPCVGDRLETEIVLKQTMDFLSAYRHKPHFGFTFVSGLSHDALNHAGAADDPHFRYLQKFRKEGLLNNTVLIYFSDHGCRFGNIRKTFVGKLEERLPLLFLVFPKWFKKKYPEIMKNLQINAHRLTTPFDVYETLKDIVTFDGKVNKINVSKRGISLFNEVSRDRSCDDAGILPHWCVCLETEKLQTSSKEVKGTANHIVTYINNMLKNHSNVCEILEVIEITDPVRMGANEKVLNYLKRRENVKEAKQQRTKSVIIIQLVLKTKPGNALFESTVRFDETKETYALVGDISRINKYGDHSHCVDDFRLKKYCFCKDVK